MAKKDPFSTDPGEKKPISEAQVEAEKKAQAKRQDPNQAYTSQDNTQQEQAGNGGDYNFTQKEQPIIIEPPRNRFIGFMVLMALGLSAFAVYKMYEPSIFNNQDLEAQASKYVSVTDFNNYRNTNQQDLEILKIKFNVLQQQFDSRISQMPAFDRSFGGAPTINNNGFGFNSGSSSSFGSPSFTSNGSSAAKSNSTAPSTNNTTSVTPTPSASEMAQIVDKYVTYERLNQIITELNNSLAQRFDQQVTDLNTRIANLTTQVSQGNLAVAPNTTPNATPNAALNGIPVPPPALANAPLSAQQVNQVLTQATQSNEFKVYLGSLIAEYVASQPKDAQIDTQSLTQSITQQVTEQVSSNLQQGLNKLEEQVNQRLAAANEQATTKAQEQVTTTVNDAINKQLDSLKATLVTEVSSKVAADLSQNLDTQLAKLDADATATKEANAKTSAELKALYQRANLVLVQQTLTQVQSNIAANNNLDSVLQGLHVAYQISPEIPELRTAIQTDYNSIAAGRNLSANAALSARLSQEVTQVAKLPALSAQQLNAASAKAQKQATSSSFAKATKDFFSKFVEVQKINDGTGTLATENLNLYVQENLKLQLLAANIAVTTNDSASYHLALQSVVATIKTLYPQDNQEVAQFLAAVQELDKANLGYSSDYKLISLQLFNTQKD